MRKSCLVISLLFLSPDVFTQTNNIVVVRGKRGTVETFFAGKNVVFKASDGRWYNSRIYNINNDSIFFREVMVRAVPTMWGVSRLDTMTTVIQGIFYKDIVAVPKRRVAFKFIKDGTIVKIGGAGYLLLNTINGSYRNGALSSENATGFLTASGVLVSGFILSKLYKDEIKISKKYMLQYIHLAMK